MPIYIAGLVIFFGTHLFTALRSRAPGKDLRARMGYGPFMSVYSLLALIGLVLMIRGYGGMRPSPELYVPPAWGQHANMALMLISFVLLISAYVPTGFIKKTAKHPMLAAVKLWAFGHLLANGEFNSVLLFGSFLAYAVIARIAARRRGDNGPGPDVTVDLRGDIIAVIVGVGAYGVFLYWLHPMLIGVPVFV